MRIRNWSLFVAATTILFAVLTAGASDCAAQSSYRVFGTNNLGMHCYDADFSVFSILPLYNEVHAQVLQVGSSPTLLNSGQARMVYVALKDPGGSINTTSRGKTNFWSYLPQLFGITRPVDVGILGARMPGVDNRPRSFSRYVAEMAVFEAQGIPITQTDDNGRPNPYPLMRLIAKTPAGTTLSSLPVVVPASSEMDCGICHLTGLRAAQDPTISWSADPNPDRQYKTNILLLHDARTGTDLHLRTPVLCAECHYSAALDLAGTGPMPSQKGQPFMSRAVHRFHAPLIPQDPGGVGTCFNCHPGRNTQCLRGVMSAAGIGCVDCHGTMFAVGRSTRKPWLHEPKCQSCHTGDALASHQGQIVRRRAFVDGANTATPLLVANKRFAEQPGKLYRNSLGHGGVACPACHGSPHAEWPSRERNDNLAAKALQGHDGVIIECRVCHGSGLALTLGGPHGLHNVADQAWIDGHDSFYQASPASCQTCHGKLGEGTVLSRTKATRVFQVEDQGAVRLFKGVDVGCGHCHGNPFLGGGGR
jgi:hypothetical protein